MLINKHLANDNYLIISIIYIKGLKLKKISYIFFIILYSIILNGCGEQVPLIDLVGTGDKQPTTNLDGQINNKTDNTVTPPPTKTNNDSDDDNSNNDDDDKNNDNDKNKNNDNDDDDNNNKDDENSENKTHNQGQSCLSCHNFASGGTIYNNSNLPTQNYTIRLVGQNGSLSSYLKGRGDGNSYVNIVNSTQFTAQVIDSVGNIVNSSATNSHDNTRLDCNRCHTQIGLNGAPSRIWNFRK